MAMLAVAAASPLAVLDSTFYPYTAPLLRRLPGPLIEIRCRCPRDIVPARYDARSQHRHPGHLDALRSPEELWNHVHLTPLGLGPLLEVDTPAVAAQITEMARL